MPVPFNGFTDFFNMIDTIVPATWNPSETNEQVEEFVQKLERTFVEGDQRNYVPEIETLIYGFRDNGIDYHSKEDYDYFKRDVVDFLQDLRTVARKANVSLR